MMNYSDLIFYKSVSLSLILILPILINSAFATDIHGPDTKKTDEPVWRSFLTYNNTVYGINMDYPSDWQFVLPPAEAVLSLLQDISSSESQGIVKENDDLTLKAFDILKTFGLEKVSDIIGLKPNERQELIQELSRALNEERVQFIAGFVSPPENQLDIFSENMNVVVENLSTVSPISLKDYVSYSIENLNVIIPGFSIIEPMKEISVDGHPAISFMFTDSIADGHGKQKTLQVYTIRGDRGYVLNFATTIDANPAYLPIFQRMLESFEINN